MKLLQHHEIESIEREFEGGLSVRAVLEIFRPRGVRLSEATFRKYVQSGLLPRSRRVGRKGKHRGSQGLYPVEVVRRINVIKKMMAEGHTIDDIRRSFVFFKNYIDQVERSFNETFDGFAGELAERDFSGRRKEMMRSQLFRLRGRADKLLQDVAKFGSIVTSSSAHDGLSK